MSCESKVGSAAKGAERSGIPATSSKAAAARTRTQAILNQTKATISKKTTDARDRVKEFAKKHRDTLTSVGVFAAVVGYRYARSAVKRRVRAEVHYHNSAWQSRRAQATLGLIREGLKRQTLDGKQTFAWLALTQLHLRSAAGSAQVAATYFDGRSGAKNARRVAQALNRIKEAETLTARTQIFIKKAYKGA